MLISFRKNLLYLFRYDVYSKFVLYLSIIVLCNDDYRPYRYFYYVMSTIKNLLTGLSSKEVHVIFCFLIK